MTPTLVRQHASHADSTPRVDRCARARDWSEIQERMLVPLYEAVYERLEVGPATRLLGLRCGSGLALLLAAGRGAAVTGLDSACPERLALARERLLPGAPRDADGGVPGARGTDGGGPEGHGSRGGRSRAPASVAARLVDGSPGDAAGAETAAYTLVTVFEPIGCLAGDSEGLGELLADALPRAARGAAVVLAGWGPPERCTTSSVLRVATKLADPLRSARSWRPARRDDLEEVAQRAGLKPDGSGRVACPFGYADVDSAVRGLLSTELFDAAIAATDAKQVDKELAEALHPHRRPDGTVWMPNVFRYLIARVR
ncbi:SAM-dependent methyltransferase [Streptomyces yokosukanensis]|uniref:SAM-dependent methyltransferase n=1 Tax=Streptomyces yokosukanensis TaxID=67386 RepID=UPI000A9838DA|nr:SAM-dependent methyltransferase [Streptomyces yokosukanensis]